MKSRSRWKKIPREEFEEIVKNSNSIQEVVKKCGYLCSGSVHKEIKIFILEHQISTAHFKKIGKRYFKKSFDKMFSDRSPVSRGTIKRYILMNNIMCYSCSSCGLSPEWNGQKLTLVLDHINGIPNDHRLENLRFLCPNCNSQTSTFAGRNTNKINAYENSEVNKNNFGNYVKVKEKKIKKEKSSKKTSTKMPKIPKEPKTPQIREEVFKIDKDSLIISLTKHRSLVKVGKEFGCSDNTIRKKCKKYQIDFYSIFNLENKKSEILKLYLKTKSISKVAMEFMTSAPKIRKILIEFIDIKTPVHLTEIQKDTIRALRAEGFSQYEISKEINTSRSTVQRYK